MSPSAPADALDRQTIIGELTSSTFVQAGAGTGKTTMLVRRIVALVESGLDLRNLAVITFTQRAAEELRHRIRRALLDAREVDGANTQPQRIRDALAQIDEAAIGTIHSFARGLLAEYALDSGLPPVFETLSGAQANRHREIRWRLVAEQLQAKQPAELAYLESLGIPLSSLKPVVTALDDMRLHLPGHLGHGTGGGESVRVAIESLAATLGAIQREVHNACIDPDDTLARKILGGGFEALRRQAEKPATPADVRMTIALAEAATKFGNSGRSGNWPRLRNAGGPKAFRDEVKQLVAQRVAAVATAAVAEPVTTLIAAAAAELDEAARGRRSAGEIEFDDLLLICRDLLKEKPDICSRIARQFRVILVDEFQDTDPVQWEIVKAITGALGQGERPGMGDSSAAAPAPLTLVGDPQQSIYRFRGADVGVYRAVHAQFEDDPGRITPSLKVNFRSRREILQWVNTTFSPLIVEQGSIQPRYARLDHDEDIPRLAPDEGPPVLLLRDEEVDPKALDAALECRFVAAAVHKALAEKWQVRGDDQVRRDARLRDMAVLIPTRTSLDQLLNTLDDFGIMYRSPDPAIIFTRPMTAGLINAVRAIADSADEMSLVFALKSPLFGFSDADLLAHARQSTGNPWRLHKPEPTTGLADLTAATDPDDPVVRALELLYVVRAKVGAGRPGDALQALVTACRIPTVLQERNLPEFEWDCVRQLVEHAQQWETDGNTGVGEYVEELDRMMSEKGTAPLGIPDDRDADALQILTVHAAKGLEYPLVVLAGMSTRIQSATKPLFLGQGGKVEFHVRGLPLPEGGDGNRVSWYSEGFEAAREAEKEAERAELIRLLYVGTTRAKDHLIVSVLGGPASRAAILLPALNADTPTLRLDDANGLNEKTKATSFSGVVAPERGPRRAAPSASWREKLELAGKRSEETYIVKPSSGDERIVREAQRKWIGREQG